MNKKLLKYLLLILLLPLVPVGAYGLTFILWMISFASGFGLGLLFSLDVLTASLIPFLIPLLVGLILALHIIHRLWLKRRVPLGIIYLFCVSLLTTWQFIDGISHHRPAVNVVSGVEMQMVDRSDWSINARKSLQNYLELDGDLVYEILGWADPKTLVYKRWHGEGFAQAKAASSVEAYHVDTGQQTPFTSALNTNLLSTLSRKTCPYESCIQPLLTLSWTTGRERRPVYPGYFWDVVVSPDQKWAAFLVDYLYGAYDLVVISTQGDRPPPKEQK